MGQRIAVPFFAHQSDVRYSITTESDICRNIGSVPEILRNMCKCWSFEVIKTLASCAIIVFKGFEDLPRRATPAISSSSL